MGDDSLSDAASYEKQSIEDMDELRHKLMSEAGKLKMMPEMSAESTVVRNYLDTVLGIPWGEGKD